MLCKVNGAHQENHKITNQLTQTTGKQIKKKELHPVTINPPTRKIAYNLMRKEEFQGN